MAVDISKIDRDTCLRSVFPERGTYLTEEIEETVVPPSTLVMRSKMPVDMTDKLSASDTLRIGRNPNANVLMPIHWDMWATQCPNPNKLVLLHDFNKHQMKFKLVIWKVGGKFAYPDDQDIGKYVYPRDSDDFFTDDLTIPFPSFL